MRIIVKKVKDLTDIEYAYCHRANMGDKGVMQSQIEYSKNTEKDMAVMLWDDSRKGTARLIGWALMFKEIFHPRKRTYAVNFYVKHAHRNKGYGTQLMRAVKQNTGFIPRVQPWSPESLGFFSKFKVVNQGYTPLASKPIVC